MTRSMTAATALVSGVMPWWIWPKMNSGRVSVEPDTNERDHVVVEAERERQQEARDDRRQELGQGDLAERPPRRRVQVVARVDERPVHPGQAGPDEQQDEAQVEQDVGRDDRPGSEDDPRRVAAIAGEVGEPRIDPVPEQREQDQRREGDDDLGDDDAHVGQRVEDDPEPPWRPAAARAPPSSRRSSRGSRWRAR